jgi:hypothetical protein
MGSRESDNPSDEDGVAGAIVFEIQETFGIRIAGVDRSQRVAFRHIRRFLPERGSLRHRCIARDLA